MFKKRISTAKKGIDYGWSDAGGYRSGPVNINLVHSSLQLVRVTSAADMFEACLPHFNDGCFSSDFNKITILRPAQPVKEYPLKDKKKVADDILTEIEQDPVLRRSPATAAKNFCR
jgi:phosphopantothenoylcysteine decarboxylase / phosphopantothenate---cysteine ligase